MQGHAKVELDAQQRLLQQGPTVLSDTELLALLLSDNARRDGCIELAQSLLMNMGGVLGLTRSGPHALCSHQGIERPMAARVLAALELGARALSSALFQEREPLDSFDCVASWAMPRLASLDHEEMWLLVLDAQNGIRSARCIGRGGLHGCALTAGDVLRPAIRDAASAIVLVHNHPSGDPTPSAADRVMTRIVEQAADLVGIELLDHVIVARAGARSLRQDGAVGSKQQQ